MFCSCQGPIWPLLPAQTAETFQASRLSVVQTDDKVKATLLTPAQPVDSIISAAHLTPASGKGTGFITVPIGSNGGGKLHCLLNFLFYLDTVKYFFSLYDLV
jgi:hypothetical protein